MIAIRQNGHVVIVLNRAPWRIELEPDEARRLADDWEKDIEATPQHLNRITLARIGQSDRDIYSVELLHRCREIREMAAEIDRAKKKQGVA